MGRREDARAIGPLVRALIDLESPVRQAAAQSLEAIDPHWVKSPAARQTLPDLESALARPEYWIRVNAAEIIARLEGLPPPDPPLQ